MLGKDTQVWWLSQTTWYLEDITCTEGQEQKRYQSQARVEAKRMREEKAETPVSQLVVRSQIREC